MVFDWFKIFKVVVLLLFIGIGNAHAQKKLEYEGGEYSLVSRRLKGGVPSASVIIESTVPLNYTTNMEDIESGDMRRGMANGIHSDTMYFFLTTATGKTRSIIITAQGYPEVVIPFKYESKKTFKYLVFDPLERNTFKGNYDKGMEFFIAGNYLSAADRFEQALKCNDVPTGNDAKAKIQVAKDCDKYVKMGNQLYASGERLRYDKNRGMAVEDKSGGLDSVLIYFTVSKQAYEKVVKSNPADRYSAERISAIKALEPTLERPVGGEIKDYASGAALSGVSVYAVPKGVSKVNDMVLLGYSDKDGKFFFQVRNSYEAIYFVYDNLKNYKPVMQPILPGKTYKFNVRLQYK